MKAGKVLLGILAGTAAGALAGILLAPQKGSRTRRQILNKSEDYADGLKEKIEDMVLSLTKQYNTAVSDVDELVAKGKSKFNHALVEVDHLMTNSKEIKSDKS
ncbi:MAG: YtxH domain-containing protein [Cytophagaceae bacterium]|nr:YtxH domain-containing protein [Cytophagaceae bacterium]MBK9508426.1 YtxH domain-containing protein [Cytophagaceae bacterium]MBK9932861.1 YtxH domain-containing protein [Cytophagaceae bacterium]MBL0303450.1 YtxH domain-containing protein [Cytophagaceae bacterium]MBL0326278.1 YtxH domain-containing protein [Cytophagaceae bacterium]